MRCKAVEEMKMDMREVLCLGSLRGEGIRGREGDSIPAVREEGKTVRKDFQDELSKVEPEENPVHGISCCRPPLSLWITRKCPSQAIIGILIKRLAFALGGHQSILNGLWIQGLNHSNGLSTYLKVFQARLIPFDLCFEFFRT
jgi:hypothetical protein